MHSHVSSFLQQFDTKIFEKQFWNKGSDATGFAVFSGRDGNKSCCILYYRFADVARQSTMVFTERTGLENLYSIVAYCTDVTRWVFLLWSCWKYSWQMRCLEPLWCESCGSGLVQMTDVNGSVADRWGVWSHCGVKVVVQVLLDDKCECSRSGGKWRQTEQMVPLLTCVGVNGDQVVSIICHSWLLESFCIHIPSSETTPSIHIPPDSLKKIQLHSFLCCHWTVMWAGVMFFFFLSYVYKSLDFHCHVMLCVQHRQCVSLPPNRSCIQTVLSWWWSTFSTEMCANKVIS